MTQYPIDDHPDYYFIIRPGIDFPKDESYNRACLYLRTPQGDRWLTNELVGNKKFMTIHNTFVHFITTHYATDNNQRPKTAYLHDFANGNTIREIVYMHDLRKYSFTLTHGYEMQIDAEAIKEPLVPGMIYHVTGTWMNYTKTNPPQFVLALTSAKISN